MLRKIIFYREKILSKFKYRCIIERVSFEFILKDEHKSDDPIFK